MKKRGQISLYVIIGLIVLTTVVATLYTKDYIIKTIFKLDLESEIIIPERIKPVNAFILSCLKETGERAINLIGQQGGYTTIPNDQFASTQLNLVSNALTIYNEDSVAYWFYEQPNKIQKTKIPSKIEMEYQISDYIENNIYNCINNFKDFAEYEIIEGDIKVNVLINKNNIDLSLNYPLDIKIKDFEFKELNKFSQEINSPLLDLYESAVKILDNLNKDNPLEYKTIAMLVSYEEIPFSSTTDSCILEIWSLTDVEKNLKKIISNNIQVLKIKGTSYSITDSDSNYFVLEPNLKDPQLDVNFLYSENWPINLDVNPKKDGVLQSQSVTEKLGPLRGLAESFVCINTYHFIYDIKYPVLIILNKNSYTFQFATQVIIDNNEPRHSTINTPSFEGFDQRVCNTKVNELTVFTRDINNNPIENVTIKYKCINNICDIGNTKINSFNEAVSVEKYPQCLNGVIIGIKDKYHPAKQIVSTFENSVSTLFLEPYRNLDVDVLIERAGSGKIEKDEQVYIQISENEKSHSQTILYPENKKIKLIPGDYQATIYLVSNFPEGLNIKEQTIENCFEVPKKGIISSITKETEKKCIKTKIPGQTVNKLISGFAEFEFSISDNDLLKDKITFHVPYVNNPTTLSQLNKVFQKQNVPKPEFK